MNNTQKRIKIQQEKQEKEMQLWWDGYWEKLERYNEPERVAHRKEIENYLKEVGQHFNLK